MSSRPLLRAALTLSACLLALLLPRDVAAFDAERVRTNLNAFDEALDPANALSGVFLIARDGEVVLLESFGMADYAHAVPNTPDTRFGIASLTKVMTGLVVWQLLVEERLSLETTLAELVPEFPRGDEITVEHLFRHRAGIPHRVTGECAPCTPQTAASITKLAMEHPLMVEPGSESIYSSAGYTVLARVVEIVEGQPFAQVLNDRVFRPAGMTRTLDVDGRTIVPDLARAYVPGRGELLNAPLVDLSYLTGAGSVISTAEDLLRFVYAYQDGRLGEGAWEALNGSGPEAWTGASAGYHGFVNWIPETATVVIYLGNTFGGGPGQLRGHLDALLRGEEVTPSPLPAPLVTVDTDVLARYVGVYAPRPGARMEVSLRGRELLIAGSVVLPLSETEFYFQNWARTLAFAPDGQDYVLVNGDARWPRTGER